MAATSASSGGAYSCETAAQTREWMEALAAFLRLHLPLLEAHAVNFFKDRLWEMEDAEWMECLRREPVESLLKLPSGCIQSFCVLRTSESTDNDKAVVITCFLKIVVRTQTPVRVFL